MRKFWKIWRSQTGHRQHYKITQKRYDVHAG